MNGLYNILPVLSGTIFLPANAVAGEAKIVHATTPAFLLLLAAAIFTAWLLYRAIKKKSDFDK